ncbi:MAG: serine/threonine-protein kinase [Acidobacteriota bacterium]|nr:serine/threonine-protein kinase [Acidobacteriota bacterium]
MIVSAGTRLGPYEILSPLGAGGMGEVYRAWDTRLQREVAVKVLPAELSSDAARLKRFETEARLASALNHPNIVTIHEVGQCDSTAFIVMELVDGKTLGEVLRGGPLPLRKLLSIASQVADGLAKAHASGIVHRDLKPENVMVTSDGFVKILDFGLAKLTHPESEKGQTNAATIPGGTEPGVVMGTVGYMSPEQAVGQRVDFRSDQFSFGSILYEMVTGRQAFDRATGPEILAAIIRDEPEPIATANPRVPLQLRWIVERCLGKESKDRYAATEDLSRDLATLREHASDLSGEASVPLEAPRRRPKWGAIGPAAALLATMAGIYLLGRRVERSHTSPPRFRQLTFRGAGISTARFAPDGQTVVYAAQWEGKPSELFTARIDSPETRSLGLARAEILSISSSGRMAVLLTPRFGLLFRPPHLDLLVDLSRLRGVLAEAPLAGGAPRELLEDAYAADWSPDAKSLALARYVDGKNRLEFPAGRVLYESIPFALNHISISPSGDRVAFVSRLSLYVTEPGGGARDLRERPLEAVWNRPTNEIWFNSVAAGTTELFAVVPGRPKRRVTTLPGDFVLHDISADGRVLLGRTSESSEIFGDFPGDARRNLSHLDRSVAVAVADSGDTVVFNEVGQGDRSGVYLRRTDGSPPKRLAERFAWALSPDGKFVLANARPDLRIFLIPTGPGQQKRIETPGVKPGGRMGFFPDNQRIWFMGEDPVQGRRAWVQDLIGGKPRALTPPGVVMPVMSGDGRFVCARAPNGAWYLYSTESTTEAHKVVGLLPGEEPTQWTADGKLLYVRSPDELLPGESTIITRVHRLDPHTGHRELWKEMPPINPSGGGAIGAIFFSADGKTCVYTHHRYTSELFLVEGLK